MIPPAQCHKVIPQQLIDPVKPEPIPDLSEADRLLQEGDQLGSARSEAISWQTANLGNAGQLSKANADKPAIVHIVKTCEDLVNSARPRKKILGIF